MKRIVYILLLALLLTACGKEKTQGPTVTTDPTTAPTTATAMAEVEKFQKLFKEEYWYRRALGCTFEKPEDISLRFYFYTGTGEIGEDDYKYFTSEEQAFLAKAYMDKNGREEYTMATRLPVKKINKALSILGVTLEDVEIPESWVYYDQTDAYYFWVSDAYGADPWKVTKVENGTNGIVKVYWEGPQRHLNTATNKFYTEDYPRMVMTLQKKPDGRIFVLSNLPVNNTR